MTSRSGRGRWQRVVEARRQARKALGHEPPGGDRYGPPKAKTPARVPELPRIKYGPGVYVLLPVESAQRLGVSLAELNAMIDAGKIETLPTAFTRVIPSAEVRRLGGR